MSKKSPPWFKAHTSEILAELSEMSSNAQHLWLVVFFMMLDTDGPVPFNGERIALKLRRAVAEIDESLAELVRTGKIHESNGLISIPLATETLEARRADLRRQSENGMKGNKTRWGAKKSHGDPSAMASRTVTDTEAMRKHPDPIQTETEIKIQTENSSENINMADSVEISRHDNGNLSRLSPDFALTQPRIQAAHEMGIRLLPNIEEAFEHFKAHNIGKGSLAADWDQMWRNWVANRKMKKEQSGHGRAFEPSI